MYSVKQVIKDALSKFWTGYKKNVVDNLTSKNTDLPLSANMGRELNSKLTGKYMLVRVDTVVVPVGDVNGNYITDAKEITFSKYSDDALCIPIFKGAGWLGCTKYEINGNKLAAWFYSWSGGTHSGAGTFDILQFVKVS